MPGRLLSKMNNNGVEPGVIMNGKPVSGRPEAHKASLTNGDIQIPGLGAYPTPNGVSPASPPTSSILDLPPELRHVTEDYKLRQITEGYQPLGTLIARVTQECFNGLGDVVDALAAIQLPAPLTNGASNNAATNGVENNSQANQQKKLLMLNFANSQRNKLIKLLVLSQWSRNVAEVGKMIDLIHWSGINFFSYQDVGDRLANVKFETHHFKLRNPDMETALAVLSTGKVPWMPKLNYIPPTPLSPRKILKTLQNLNILLAIRLNLHEDLIPQLREYRIANGRATFSLPNEFELDVTISSEDPETSFFFLDLRFLFAPAPQISSGPLRDKIEFNLNVVLKEHGLQGACDFIHSFILTHKVSILRKQAIELSRGIWASSVRVERIHRTLVVQYWLDSPQPKSWVEIGINSGKRKSALFIDEDAITSLIKVKWMENDKEVTDIEVPIDLENLSLERLIRSVTALHISRILRTIHNKLTETKTETLSVELSTSDTEPLDCSLGVRLGSFPAVKLGIDPITGRLFLQPSSSSSAGAQRDLERMSNPAVNAHSTLSKYMCYEAHQVIEKQAEYAGWTPVRNFIIKPDLLKESTKLDVQRHGFFRPASWKLSDWVIAYTVNLAGERWWAMELSRTPVGDSIKSCHPLETKLVDGTHPPISQNLLKRVEHYAIRALAFFAACTDLNEKRIDNSVRWILRQHKDVTYPEPHVDNTEQGTKGFFPTLCIRSSHLLRGEVPFAAETLLLQYTGFDSQTASVKLVAKAIMIRADRLPEILTTSRTDGVAFDASGNFSLVVQAELGKSCVSRVVAQLRTIGRVTQFADVLKERNLHCKEISLTRVVFNYADNLDAELLFSSTSDADIVLKLQPDSPHRRIVVLLQKLLNIKTTGFNDFVEALAFSFPLLRAFDTIENKYALTTDLNQIPSVHPRNTDFFRLTYSNVLSQFDLRSKLHDDKREWHIHDATPPATKEERAKQFPKVAEELKGLFRRVGKGWTGMQSSIAASTDGAEEAVLAIDEIITQHRPKKESATAVAVPAQTNGRTAPEVIMLD